MKIILLLLVFLLLQCAEVTAFCDVFIFSTKKVFVNGEKIDFKILGEGNVEYWIEDINGTIVKQKRNTTLSSPKYFTPSNLEKDIVILAKQTGCNNISRRTILFVGGNNSSEKQSTILMFEIDKNIEKLEEFKKNDDFQDKNNQLIRLVPYFLVTLTTLISIVLIWKR